MPLPVLFLVSRLFRNLENATPISGSLCMSIIPCFGNIITSEWPWVGISKGKSGLKKCKESLLRQRIVLSCIREVLTTVSDYNPGKVILSNLSIVKALCAALIYTQNRDAYISRITDPPIKDGRVLDFFSASCRQLSKDVLDVLAKALRLTKVNDIPPHSLEILVPTIAYIQSLGDTYSKIISISLGGSGD